jgi:hypothetical protein
MNRITIATAIGVAAVALGCSGGAKPDQQASHAKRVQRAEAKLSKPPEPKTLKVGTNEVVVVAVPTGRVGSFVQLRQCIVWRDLEFKTATMSCDPPEVDMDFSDDAPSDNDPLGIRR